MVDVQPGFYKGVDWYEQAWKADSIIHPVSDIGFGLGLIAVLV